jgi:hypothetical protein
MNYDKFLEIISLLDDFSGEFEFKLDDNHSFCVGMHGSMYGTYQGYWIRVKTYVGTEFESVSNVMDSVTYESKDFYNFMKERNLLDNNFKFNVEEVVLNGL